MDGMKLLKTASFYALAVVIVVFSVFPFYYAIVTPFSTGSALFAVHCWPVAWDWSNYQSVLGGRTFPRNFLNSVFISAVTVAFALTLAVTAFYALARVRFRGRSLLLMTILGVSMFPQIAVLAGLFDEPLSNLDAALRVQTRLEIAKLHHAMSNVTMICVTHDQVEAMTLADRIAVLRDGLLEQVGCPAELYDNPNSIFVAGFIGSPEMNFLTGKFAADQSCTALGIRSEHIEIAGNGMWTGEVVHTGDLGSDNYLFVEMGGEEAMIVRQPGKLKVALGAKISLNPMEGQLHKFDANCKPMR